MTCFKLTPKMILTNIVDSVHRLKLFVYLNGYVHPIQPECVQ